MNQENTEENFIFETFNKLFQEYAEKTYQALKKSNSFSQYGQLYHYTSLDAFQKIIENESLRATSIYMQNDPNELTHGFEKIINWYSDDLSKKLTVNDRYTSYFGFPAFVFSLTELEDDMHLWEKYANQHKGIRIGFSPEEFMTPLH